MKIILFNFSKKINSTKQPILSSGTPYNNCQLKEGCSVISPDISFNIGLLTNPTAYNYAYIEEFNRYYFIDDWTFIDSLWVARMSVDALASWKTEIGSKTLYVLRSASEYDGSIVDNLYPLKVETSFSRNNLGDVYDTTDPSNPILINNYFKHSLTEGYYIIGVLGNNRTGVTYYSLSAVAFNSFVRDLLNFSPTDMSDVSAGIAKAFANPIQFITTCYWASHAPWQDDRETINLGHYSFSSSGCYKLPANGLVREYESTITIPKHPQASTRGKYLNINPYSRYSLMFNPFGVISIDSSKIVDETSLKLAWLIDLTTGEAELRVRGSNNSANQVYHGTAKMLVPIQLSQITVDTIGGVGSVISSGIGAGINFATGNILGGITSLASGITSAVQGMQPEVNSKGTLGSLIAYKNEPRLNSCFTEIVDEDIDHAGRPLCQERRINEMDGYNVCRDGDIEIPATASELNTISGYLTGGFFFE